jgi:flagellar hook-associated protein 2
MNMFNNNIMRLGGLHSGLDTENMVRQLMRAQSIRLDRLRQRRTMTEWRQQAYRSAAETLREFQSKRLDVLATNNIRLASSFNSVKATGVTGGTNNDGSGITVTTNSNSKPGSYELIVTQTAARDVWIAEPTPRSITGGAFTGNFNPATEEYTFGVRLNGGANVSITLSGAELAAAEGSPGGLQAVANLINEKLMDRFGQGTGALGSTLPKVYMEVQGSSLQFVAQEGHTASIHAGAGDDGADFLTKLGFSASGGSTAFDTSVFARDVVGANFIVNGITFIPDENNADETLQQFMNRVSNSNAGVTLSFDTLRSAFKIESKETGAQAAINMSGDFAANFATTNGGVRESIARDAVFTFNGVTTSRSSNQFTLEGINFTLSSNMKLETIQDRTFNIELGRDPEPVMNLLKGFVEDYNNIIRFLNDQTRTARPRSSSYSVYEPLTDEQKKGMSEREIEQWEEKAKTGILFRSDIMTGIMSQMRDLIYRPVTDEHGNSISLHQIGITTSNASGNIGLLQIDEDRLRAAITTNGDEVQRLFTQTAGGGLSRNERLSNPRSGLGERLNDIIENAVSASGSIGQKAGFVGTASVVNNALSHELRDHDRRIDLMLDNLRRKEQSFYMMFSRLEAALAKSDAQMQSLMSAMGGF